MNHEGVFGEIEISPCNTMKATYSIIGSGSSNISAEIEVAVIEPSDINTEISIKASKDDDISTELEVKYRGLSDILIEIQPVGHNNISAEIEIRPHNRMWALFEVQEPPRVTKSFEPIKDAFTRTKKEFEVINYGYNNSLMIGRTEDDSYESFIQFSFLDWNPRFKIIESKLRLYYSRIIPEGIKLESYTLDKHWSERGITNLNKPSVVELIADDYIDFPNERYIEIDLTKIVSRWAYGLEDNKGLLIKSTDDSTDAFVGFRSRESNRSPELDITYYDARIYSSGRSQTLAEIFVWQVGNSNVLAEVEVGSVIANSDRLAEIYVHRYEAPVHRDADAEIIVTRPNVDTEVTVSIQDESEIFTEITARSDVNYRWKNTEINVSKPDVLAEVFVSFSDDILTEIEIQRKEDSKKATEISVTREFVNTEIFVKYDNSVETEIEIQRDEDSIVLSEISVTRDHLLTEIISRALSNSDIGTEIATRALNDSCLLSEITATRDNIPTEITPRVSDESNVVTEMVIRALGEDSNHVDIVVTKEQIPTEITVTEYIDVETEIFVKYIDSVESEINIKVFNQISAEIDVVISSLIDTEIAVTRLMVPVVITVPTWDDSDVSAEILPRILKVNDIDTEIAVKRFGGAYVFII